IASAPAPACPAPTRKSRLSPLSNTSNDSLARSSTPHFKTPSTLCSFYCRPVGSLRWGGIESFDQFHYALQKFLVRQTLLRPALQDLVHAVTFLVAELVIQQIRVVNH